MRPLHPAQDHLTRTPLKYSFACSNSLMRNTQVQLDCCFHCWNIPRRRASKDTQLCSLLQRQTVTESLAATSYICVFIGIAYCYGRDRREEQFRHAGLLPKSLSYSDQHVSKIKPTFLHAHCPTSSHSAQQAAAAARARRLTCPKMSSELPKRSAKGAGSIVVTASSYLGGGTYLLQAELVAR